MTKARILKSRMTRKWHVRFGSGGGVGDRPADHDLGGRLGHLRGLWAVVGMSRLTLRH